MTNKHAEMVLGVRYRDATKELLDLVMASEKAFETLGKFSFFGKDKGKESEEKFNAALCLAIMALGRVGMIKDIHNAEESFQAIEVAMDLVKAAYPNWPRAYRYWDSFLASTYVK